MNTGGIGGAGYSQTPQVEETAMQSKTRITGKTVGEVQLSQKAAKYYEQLQRKYGNMDFVLVSPDKKEQAQAQAGQFANAGRTVVLIDTDKIEKMAEDEDYRKKYEGIIQNAGNELSKMASSLGSTASAVKTFGVKIDDGGNASYFAVIDRSFAAQRERIQKNREKKAEEAKKSEVKEEKAKEQERIADRKRENKKTEDRDSDYVMVTSGSIEELSRKIQDAIYNILSDSLYSEPEKKIGQNVDFSI